MKYLTNNKVLSAITCMITASVLYTSCINTQKENKENKPQKEFITEAINWESSEEVTGCKFYLDYPKEDSTLLSKNIKEWINDKLGGTYSGSLDNGKNLLDFYGNKQKDLMTNNKEEYPFSIDSSSYYIQIRRDFESEKFISYTYEEYTYNGGAHGGESLQGITFRKEDGQKLGWDMFRKDVLIDKLPEMIKQSLMSDYFKVSDENDFYNLLLVEDYNTPFPLPESEPYFTKNGLKFVYQQYEIAPYSAGIPYCIIPYNKIKELLTTSMTTIIESTNDDVAKKKMTIYRTDH